MSDDGQACGHTQGDGAQEGSANGYPIRKVVECIPHQDQGPGCSVYLALRVVTMSPEHQLLQDKEENDPAQHSGHHRKRACLAQSVGYQSQKGSTQ